MNRIFSLIIGYVFGLFQTAYIYGRMNNIDIRDHGSGNAGTTNAMRTLGKKAGIITYIGDMSKAVLAAVVVHFVFGQNDPDSELMLFCYSGLGVVLGHNFPFYLGFKGGKGIAATSGVVISFIPYNWILTVLGFVTFATVVLVSKYVSLGSLIAILGFFVEFVILGSLGILGENVGHLYEAYAVIGFMTALGFIRHKENIKRLFNGTERKIGEKKVKTDEH